MRCGASVRAHAQCVNSLLVGGAEGGTEAGRGDRGAGSVAIIYAEHLKWRESLRQAVSTHSGIPAEVTDSVLALAAMGDQAEMKILHM